MALTVARILAAYPDATTGEIADRTGASQSYVRKVRSRIRKGGSAGTPRYRSDVAPEIVSQIVGRYTAGHGLKRIRKELKVGENLIRSVLAFKGIAVRPPGREVMLPRDPLRADILAGMEVKDIARRYGVTMGSVISIAKHLRSKDKAFPKIKKRRIVINVPQDVWDALGEDRAALASKLVTVAVRDNMIAAILDE